MDPTTACAAEVAAWRDGYRRGADTLQRRVVALLTAAGQHALAETAARIDTEPPGAWTPGQEAHGRLTEQPLSNQEDQ